MYRTIVIETPNYINSDYIRARDKFIKNEKLFDKYYVKKKALISKTFNIKLIGFDGKVKKTYNTLDVEKIINDIKKMPMGKLVKDIKLK